MKTKQKVPQDRITFPFHWKLFIACIWTSRYNHYFRQLHIQYLRQEKGDTNPHINIASCFPVTHKKYFKVPHMSVFRIPCVCVCGIRGAILSFIKEQISLNSQYHQDIKLYVFKHYKLSFISSVIYKNIDWIMVFI